jgi:hypothetical protein
VPADGDGEPENGRCLGLPPVRDAALTNVAEALQDDDEGHAAAVAVAVIKKNPAPWPGTGSFMNSSVHIEAVTQGGITQAPQQHRGGVTRGLGWLMPFGVLGSVGDAAKRPAPD